jgi:hypothetical protein
MVDEDRDLCVARREAARRAKEEEERKHAYRVEYYARHREAQRAAADAWKAAHPERARALNRKYAKNASRRKAAKKAARARGRAWYAEHCEQERERARQFRREHPDKVREYQQRYRDRHPERAVEVTRRASQKWRDRNALIVRARGREVAAERRAADPDMQRRYYHANLDQERARSREASRLRSRLRQLGLPLRRLHRVYAEEKRANAAAADEFFSRRRTREQQRDIELERDATPEARRHILETRFRVQGIASAVQLEETQEANAIAHERVAWRAALPVLIRSFARTNRDRIREEIRLDSVARQYSGKPAYDTAVELARRIRIECFVAIAHDLVPDHDPIRLGRLHATMFPRHTAATSQALADDARRREAEAQRLIALIAERDPNTYQH